MLASAAGVAPLPALGFVDEAKLKAELREAVLRHCGGDSIVESLVTGLGPGAADSAAGRQTAVVTGDGEVYTADLVVAADGPRSTTRALLFDPPRCGGVAASPPGVADIPSILQPRGYTVFRGRSPSAGGTGGQRVTDRAFQTWGPDIRFACVPTATGNAWYIAVSDSLLRERGFDPDHGLVPAPMSTLFELCGGWHLPITELLESSASSAGLAGTGTRGGWSSIGDVVVTGQQAVAFARPVLSSLSGIHRGGLAVAFVGDAAHTLDPILAQGAGVAIEDATLLATALVGAGGGGGGAFDGQLAARLAAYESTRQPRVDRLHHISNFAQTVGHVSSPVLCAVRDAVIRATPAAIKSPVFDHSVRASLGCDSLWQRTSAVQLSDPALAFKAALVAHRKFDS